MTDSTVNPATIKKTQEMLGKFIKKPALTEKLLNKPPFRFIHDIINAVIKETGFLEGVYTKTELISDNIKDRDAKINFLQKLIDVIKVTTKENVAARPSKIVAGHEAEKTNELLQLIGMAIENKLDHKQAIETIQTKGKTGKTEKATKTKSNSKDQAKINGVKETKDAAVLRKESSTEKKADKNQSQTPTTKKSISNKSSTKLSSKAKDENFIKKDIAEQPRPDKKLDSISKKSSKPLGPAVNENINSVEVRRSSIETNKSSRDVQKTKVLSLDGSSKEELLEIPPSKQIELKDVASEEVASNEVAAKGVASKKVISKEVATKEEASTEVVQKEIAPSEEASKDVTPKSATKLQKAENLQHIQKNGLEKTEDTEIKGDAKESSETSTRKKSSSKRKKSQVEGALNTASKEHSKRSNGKSNEEEAMAKLTETQDQESLKDISVPATTVAQATVPPPVLAEVKRQSTFVREESQNEITNGRPRTSLRPPSVRPASARPGAPRRRDKNVEIILQPNDQVKLAGINVRLENFGSQLEDDGENLIIVENSTADDTKQLKNEPQLDDESQQGHLVQQILQTQKELVQGDSEATAMNDIDIATFNKRQSSARQMDSLRDVIQHLTRSVNPLGKLMDFLPEDIDSMHMELNMWRDSYILAASELRKEKSLTETALEPMKIQLTQINANIKEHKELIDQVRGKILQNSEKIDKLLAEQ